MESIFSNFEFDDKKHLGEKYYNTGSKSKLFRESITKEDIDLQNNVYNDCACSPGGTAYSGDCACACACGDLSACDACDDDIVN